MDNNAGGLGSTPTPDNSKSPVAQPPTMGGGVVSPATTSAPSANLENSAATAASTPVEGAIFSGPTATNSLSGTGQPDRETVERARQFFAHHPAHTYSREMGDIVIGGEVKPKKMNKKPLIIGGIALGACAILAVALFAIANLTDKETSVRANLSVRDHFNMYANYLISGNADSTMDPEEGLSAPFNSYIVQVLWSGEADGIAATYDKAQSLLASFVQAYETADTQTSLLDNLVAMETSQLTSLREYALTSSLDSPTMSNLYLESGGDALLQAVNSMYEPLQNSPDSLLAIVASDRIQIANNLITIYDYFQLQGCLMNGTVQESCVDQLPLPENILSAQSQIASLEDEVEDFSRQMIVDLFGVCQNLLVALEPEKTDDVAALPNPTRKGVI